MTINFLPGDGQFNRIIQPVTAKLIALSLMIFLCGSSISAQNSAEDDSRVIKSIFDHVLTDGVSYPLLDHLCNKIGHRLSGSEGAKKAVAWTKSVMEDYGFDRVFLQEVMVPHWERGDKEIARIVGSAAGDSDLSVLAIGGSVGTPAQGLTAEVIEVQSLDEVDELGDAVRGKIVFYNRAVDQRHISTGAGYGSAVDQRTSGASRAAKYGAAAVVMRSATTSFDDAPHTGTLIYADSLPRIPAAALGVQSAMRLSAALAREKKVSLFMKMSCVWHPDALSHNVVGELTGTEFPDQYIVVGGHLDSWDIGQGAHDDGAGTMQSVGVLRTFQKLGIKPRHSIRAVMFMNEENGTRGGKKYAELAAANNEQHIFAIESDAGGASPRGIGVTASDIIIEKMRNWLHNFDPATINYIRKGGGGVDIGPLNRSLGVPVAGLITDTQRLFHWHHSANDVFTAVDRRELELGCGAMAGLIYLIDKYGLEENNAHTN